MQVINSRALMHQGEPLIRFFIFEINWNVFLFRSRKDFHVEALMLLYGRNLYVHLHLIAF